MSAASTKWNTPLVILKSHISIAALAARTGVKVQNSLQRRCCLPDHGIARFILFVYFVSVYVEGIFIVSINYFVIDNESFQLLIFTIQ